MTNLSDILTQNAVGLGPIRLANLTDLPAAGLTLLQQTSAANQLATVSGNMLTTSGTTLTATANLDVTGQITTAGVAGLSPGGWSAGWVVSGSGGFPADTGTASGGIGIGFNTANKTGYLQCVAPNAAWLPIVAQGVSIQLNSAATNNGLLLDSSGNTNVQNALNVTGAATVGNGLTLTGNLTMTGEVLSSGASSGFSTNDRSGSSGSGTFYRSGGVNRLWDNTVGDVITYSSSLINTYQAVSVNAGFLQVSSAAAPTLRVLNTAAPGPSGGTAGRYVEHYADANGQYVLRFVNGAYTSGPTILACTSDANSNPQAMTVVAGTSISLNTPALTTTGLFTAATGASSGVTIPTTNSSFAGNTLRFYNDGNAHIEAIQGSNSNNTLFLNYATNAPVNICGGGGATAIGGAVTVNSTLTAGGTITTSGSVVANGFSANGGWFTASSNALSTYGTIGVLGTKGGWGGIGFNDNAGYESGVFMVQPGTNSPTTGFWNHTNGWMWQWNGSTLVTGVVPAANVGVGALPNGVTATTQAATDNSTNIATTAFANALLTAKTASSLAASGYQKLPSGLIIQWTNASFSGGAYTWTYPIAFPTACVAAGGFINASGSASTTSAAVFLNGAPSASSAAFYGRAVTSSAVSNSGASAYFYAIGY